MSLGVITHPISPLVPSAATALTTSYKSSSVIAWSSSRGSVGVFGGVIGEHDQGTGCPSCSSADNNSHVGGAHLWICLLEVVESVGDKSLW